MFPYIYTERNNIHILDLVQTAQSLKRAKEIGLRKVIGASRIQLAVQLFIETIIINFTIVGMPSGKIKTAPRYKKNI